MALKGLDIFKLTPKTNCKDCGCPTCMAFAMKVAQGALPIEKCPHMSSEALATLSEATAPPMKSYKLGEHSLGGETVLSRHEKTLVSKTLYGVQVCDCMDAAKQDAVIASIPTVDYERISERMYVETVSVRHSADKSADDYVALINKVKGLGRALILDCTDVDVVIGNWHEDLPVRGIGERVMRNFTYDVNSITVSQGIDIFGAAAVSNFTMTKLVLPDGIETYGSAAFIRCEKLEEIVFGKGLKKIEYDSFMGCGENVTLYFRGTEAEWDAVQIDAQGNELMDGYTVVCNYTGA